MGAIIQVEGWIPSRDVVHIETNNFELFHQQEHLKIESIRIGLAIKIF